MKCSICLVADIAFVPFYNTLVAIYSSYMVLPVCLLFYLFMLFLWLVILASILKTCVFYMFFIRTVKVAIFLEGDSMSTFKQINTSRQDIMKIEYKILV